MKKAILAIAAFVLAASGCNQRSSSDNSEPSASSVDQAASVNDTLSQTPVDDNTAQTTAVEPEIDASTQTVLQACLQRQVNPPPANEKPPVDAKGLYANKGECRGCATGWWRTAETATLYAAPDLEAEQVKSVPSGSWLYALETVSFTFPTRGVVLKSDGKFNQCDTVYHVYTSHDEGESWDTVWRQGELLVYEEAADARIHWIGGLPFVDLYQDDGWWVHLQGRNGETGWAWATAREYEFECKWERDPEEICATAPKVPPPGKEPRP
jgi:hypothetical protein